MAGPEQAIAQPQTGQPHAAAALDIASLLHPWERSRFAVAVVGTGLAVLILLSLILASGVFFDFLLLVAFVVGSVWWGLQLARARLLGNSVKVTADTFPEIHKLVADLQARLRYTRRVDVYIVPDGKPPVTLTTYLGTHLILIDGDLAAELLSPDKLPQLCFLIARHIGALKAREYRLESFLLILNAVNALQYVKPFLWPYYRATNYSGDQIGLACCGSLDTALEGTGHLLVGRKLAPALPVGGVLAQGLMIHHRLLPRFVQLLSPTPHVVNRYVNLLMFGRQRDSEGWARVRGSLTDVEAATLEVLSIASPHRLPAAPPRL